MAIGSNNNDLHLITTTYNLGQDLVSVFPASDICPLQTFAVGLMLGFTAFPVEDGTPAELLRCGALFDIKQPLSAAQISGLAFWADGDSEHWIVKAQTRTAFSKQLEQYTKNLVPLTDAAATTATSGTASSSAPTTATGDITTTTTTSSLGVHGTASVAPTTTTNTTTGGIITSMGELSTLICSLVSVSRKNGALAEALAFKEEPRPMNAAASLKERGPPSIDAFMVAWGNLCTLYFYR